MSNDTFLVRVLDHGGILFVSVRTSCSVQWEVDRFMRKVVAAFATVEHMGPDDMTSILSKDTRSHQRDGWLDITLRRAYSGLNYPRAMRAALAARSIAVNSQLH